MAWSSCLSLISKNQAVTCHMNVFQCMSGTENHHSGNAVSGHNSIQNREPPQVVREDYCIKMLDLE
jgi:hypothetical protein